MSTTATPKATFTVSNVGSGLTAKDLAVGGSTKLKYKKDDLTLEFSLSDKTIKEASKLTDANLTFDYKVNKKLTLNGGFALDSKAYKAGATWDDELKGKKVQIKASFESKSQKVSGEATATIDKSNKATVYFTNAEITSAKYVYTKDSLTFEPSFKVKTQKPTLSVSKKQGDHTYKITYCFDKEDAGLEWKYDAVKVTMNSKLNKSGFSGKPKVALALEKSFNL